MTDLLIGLSSSFIASPPSVSPTSEVVFRKPGGAGQLFRNTEMRHSRSEDLLGPSTARRSPSPPMLMAAAASEDDLVAASALNGTSSPTRVIGPRPPAGVLADKIDPEDSIKDIVTENDLYRWVGNFFAGTPVFRASGNFPLVFGIISIKNLFFSCIRVNTRLN